MSRLLFGEGALGFARRSLENARGALVSADVAAKVKRTALAAPSRFLGQGI